MGGLARRAGQGPGFKGLGLAALMIIAGLGLVPLSPERARAASDECYYQLLQAASPSAKDLEACLRTQVNSFKALANTPQGARYLFRMAKLKVLLFRSSGQTAFLDEAVDDYRRLMKRYPDSNLADDAQFNIGEIFLQDRRDKVEAYVEYLKVEVRFPGGDMVAPAQARLRELGRSMNKADPPPAEAESRSPGNTVEPKPPAKPKAAPRAGEGAEPAGASRTGGEDPPPPANGLSQVVGIRHWSAAAYTRVVVDLTGPVEFEPHLLRPDPDLNKPARLYVDLKGAKLGSQGEKEIEIANAHLHKARLGQYDGQTVRVVLDIQAIDGYKTFILHSPERLVIDVSGPQGRGQVLAGAGPAGRPGSAGGAGEDNSLPHAPPSVEKGRRVPRGPVDGEAGPSLATQLGLGVRTVVIDPGHGGRDPGAKTCVPGLEEKEITLRVALKLAQDLRKRLGLKVILTRTKDVFVPLEERTAIANTSQADLFISIHVNAAEDRRLQGVETYFLNLATDERAIELAARENATSTKSISDLQNILNDLMLNTKINESNRLAFQTQRELMESITTTHPGAKSLGVKQAPFYVLLGAQMPAVLVEIGFGTNPKECKRLASSNYLERVATGISQGLEAYIGQTRSGG